jgi:VIT1/CCC1 family predicted Fe2+/Mn2+ transporter
LEAELTELTALYEAKGLSATAHRRRRAERPRCPVPISTPNASTPPTSPAPSGRGTALSFTSGAVLPMLAILLPRPAAGPVAFVAVLIALSLTGALSARLGGSDVRRAVRVVIGGALALASPTGACSAPPSAKNS